MRLSRDIILMSLVLATMGCSQAPPTIGFVGPLTGPSSAVGLGARNGVILAMEGQGKSTARLRPSARILVEDDENSADRCLEAFRRLGSQGCRLVILATTSQAATRAIPWAIDNGILVLSPTVSNPAFSGRDDLFIRINSPSGDYGTELAKLAYGRFGKRQIAMVGDLDNRLYIEAVCSAFREEFTREGGIIPFDLRFSSRAGMPYGELGKELAKAGADGILLATASTEAALIAKFLEKSGKAPAIFLPPWPLTLDLLRNGGKAIDGAIAISIADMEYSSEGGKVFREAYLAKFGEEPSFTAMFGFETAGILASAMASGRGSDPVLVKRRILDTGRFPGLQGDIVFDRNGDATRTLFFFEIEDGKFRRLEP